MRIKWKCLVAKVIFPLVVAFLVLIAGTILITFGMSYYESTVPYNESYMNSMRPVNQVGTYGLGLIPIGFMLIPCCIVFIGLVIREMAKPCIIKESGIMDTIFSFFSFLLDAARFVVCLLVTVLALLSFIVSIFISPAFLILTLMFVGIGYCLYKPEVLFSEETE